MESTQVKPIKDFYGNLVTFIKENQVFVSIVAFLYILPLFTSTTFSPERALLYILSELMVFGILALAFEFQLGRVGLLNFGLAAFFGLGAYTMIFFLKPTILPSPLKEIFGFPNTIGNILGIVDRLIPISFLIPLICAIGVGVILGIIMGATTNRMKGTAFAFIALAIAMVIYEIFNMQGMQGISGGDTGQSIGTSNPPFLFDWIFYLVLVTIALGVILIFSILIFQDIKRRNHILVYKFGQKRSALDYKEVEIPSQIRSVISLAVPLIILLTLGILVIPNVIDMYLFGAEVHFQRPNTYYVILTFAVCCYLFVKMVVNSPFGRVLAAISQNEERVEAMGYNVFKYKIAGVAISGGLAALAGALYVPIKIVLDPTITVGIDQTIDAMLYTIIGGLGTIFGPFLGAGVVRFSELRLVEVFKALSIPGELWLVFLGFAYVLIVLFFPWGIVGSLKLRAYKIKSVLSRIGIQESDYWWISFISIFLIIILMLNLTEENIRAFIENLIGGFG